MTAQATTQSLLAARLAAQRKERGLSQRELAEAIGIDPAAMSRVENGQRAVSVGELVQLADVLGVQVEDLLADAKPESSIWLRVSDKSPDHLLESLDLFRGVIRDYFGAQATVE